LNLIRTAASITASLLLTAVVGAQAPSALWIDVPFVRQPKDGCGAASISMVMEYWAQQQGAAPGEDSDVAQIQRLLYSPKDHGIAASQMQKYFADHGFRAFALNGSWLDLVEQLTKGRPLIAALKPQGQSELHYVVIDGIDPERGLVTMNDPAERKLLTEERAGFEKDWSATHNWMLLAVPASNSR
jgi:ABC-type bacteriocin/lantibiotic exporter with double-glycine peptidase domain